MSELSKAKTPEELEAAARDVTDEMTNDFIKAMSEIMDADAKFISAIDQAVNGSDADSDADKTLEEIRELLTSHQERVLEMLSQLQIQREAPLEHFQKIKRLWKEAYQRKQEGGQQ